MPYQDLHILVLLRESSDPRPPARAITRGAAICDRGLRRVVNPADLCALEEALHLKDLLGARVTALTVGPARLDDTLRLAFSMGADRRIRFWDHGLEGGDAVADARCLARIITILSPSLVFTGNRLLDRGDDPAAALAAAAISMPCVTAAVSLTLKAQGIEALRKGDRGGRQVVAAPFPCTLLFDETRDPRYPSVEAVTRSLTASVEEWELADLGLPFWEVGATGARLATAEYGVPRPDPVRVATPDPRLPAFERILSLLSGGIKAREGRRHVLPPEEAADGLWRILTEEGLIPVMPS
jgi:electron transfer flavoprotein beta subunit